jgi:hypothetical protein
MFFSDGRVMCQLCFEGFKLDELADDEESGIKTDVCKPCDKVDKEAVKRRESSMDDHHAG